MASMLSPTANLWRRALTAGSVARCCNARRHSYLLKYHAKQRRKLSVAVCNVTGPKLDKKHATTQSGKQHRWLSSALQDSESFSDDDNADDIKNSRYANHPCYPRLRSLRNVGVFAHVDAGKTTVTERMLALSGIVRNAGSVDDGDTVTDYLPAERERGIVSDAYYVYV